MAQQGVLHHYCTCAMGAAEWLESLIGSDLNGESVKSILHFSITKNGVHATDTSYCVLVIAIVET